MQVVLVRRALARLLRCEATGAGGIWRLVFLTLAVTAAAAAVLSVLDPSGVPRWLQNPSSVFDSPRIDLAYYPELSPSLPPSPIPPPPPPPSLLAPPFCASPTESPDPTAAVPSPSTSIAPAESVSAPTPSAGMEPSATGTPYVAPSPDQSPREGSLVDAPDSSPTRFHREITPHLLTSTEWQLVRAKREIARAPVVLNDPDLYAPLFHNVSIFRMSYELMERTLKVYVYREGPVPLCHKPILGGIYASEGWFMKLMEENKQFVTKDPSEAHLLYLPYSSIQLRTRLYVPDSHSTTPLSIFLRDYVNMISAKYPYWNRTRGADHFSVACHDWAPYITNLHEELRKNAIKAMCNADVSDRVFVRGKDVSLPETYVRTPKRPQKNVGGRPASKRPILAFYAGQMHGRVRPVLVQNWKDKDKDMKIYDVLPKEVARKMSYVQHMKSSKFCICPMGYEVNSPRIVESIHYECVPVIIADNFVLPFEELLNWSAFSVVVTEKDIPKLRDILAGISPSQYLTMQMNVKKVQKHFLWNLKPRKHDLFHMILHSIWFNRLQQIQFQE